LCLFQIIEELIDNDQTIHFYQYQASGDYTSSTDPKQTTTVEQNISDVTKASVTGYGENQNGPAFDQPYDGVSANLGEDDKIDASNSEELR
jgi:hypothetical protein